jgi:hypothetical protein
MSDARAKIPASEIMETLSDLQRQLGEIFPIDRATDDETITRADRVSFAIDDVVEIVEIVVMDVRRIADALEAIAEVRERRGRP